MEEKSQLEILDLWFEDLNGSGAFKPMFLGEVLPYGVRWKEGKHFVIIPWRQIVRVEQTPYSADEPCPSTFFHRPSDPYPLTCELTRFHDDIHSARGGNVRWS